MLKREWTKKQTIFLFLGISMILFLWCNHLPPIAGMGGADYFQIASGGFYLNSSNGCQTYFSPIPFENSYTGSMNWLLRPLSVLFSGLDVRFLASAYFLAVLLSMAYFLAKFPAEKPWHRLFIGGVGIFLFCDFAYLLHLNSLNLEGAFYAVILVTVGLLLSQFYTKPGIVRTIFCAVLAFFAAGLKTGYFWIGILLALCLLPTLFVRKELWYRVITVALAVIVSAGSVVCFSEGVFFQKEQQNQFHSVYYGILKDNPDAVSDLGLPEDARKYAGKTVYEVDASVLDDGRFQVEDRTILAYYLTHPKILWEKLERSADNAYEIRQQYVSNYPEVQKLKYGFNLYSAVKRRFLQPDFWFVLVFFGAVMVFSAIRLKKSQKPSERAHALFLILLCVAALAAFVAPIFVSGEAALVAELFLYNLLFDVVLCHVIISGTLILLKRREAIQNKYGVQQ